MSNAKKKYSTNVGIAVDFYLEQFTLPSTIEHTVLGITEKSMITSSLHSPFRYLIYIDKIPLSLLEAQVPPLLAFPCRSDVPVTSSSWPFTRLSLVTPYREAQK